jgi:hypothetical protein
VGNHNIYYKEKNDDSSSSLGIGESLWECVAYDSFMYNNHFLFLVYIIRHVHGFNLKNFPLAHLETPKPFIFVGTKECALSLHSIAKLKHTPIQFNKVGGCTIWVHWIMNELHKSSKFDPRIMFTFMVEKSQWNNIIEIHRSTLLHNTIESSQKGVA